MKRNVSACFYVTHCLTSVTVPRNNARQFIFTLNMSACVLSSGRERDDGMRRFCFNLTQPEGIAQRHTELLHVRVVSQTRGFERRQPAVLFYLGSKRGGTTIWLHDILSICLAYFRSNKRQKQRLKPLCSESCSSVPPRESYKGLYCLHRWKTVARERGERG